MICVRVLAGLAIPEFVKLVGDRKRMGWPTGQPDPTLYCYACLRIRPSAEILPTSITHPGNQFVNSSINILCGRQLRRLRTDSRHRRFRFAPINFTNRSRTAAAIFHLLIYCVASLEKAINIKRNNDGSGDGLHAVVEEDRSCEEQPVRDTVVFWSLELWHERPCQCPQSFFSLGKNRYHAICYAEAYPHWYGVISESGTAA